MPVADSDASDFTEFVLSRQDRLRRAAYLMCGDLALAEDILQEALIALASHWGSVHNPDGFVRTVLYRESVSLWRKRRREFAAERLPEVGVPDGTEDRARDEQVHRVLARLPKRQRAAIVLRYLEDLTEAQTAEIMGIRIGTVKSLSHQAMVRMRAELLDEQVRQEKKEGVR